MVTKATVARNQNLSCDRIEEKTLGEPGLSQGLVLLWPTSEQCMIMIQKIQVRSQIGLEQSE